MERGKTNFEDLYQFDDLALSKDLQLMFQAIASLNDVDRLIIMLVLDELPYSQIAEILGIKESNLRVKIHRIKHALSNKLNND